MAKCPNCGNTNPRTLSDNGCNRDDPDYTLLCTARVEESVSSYDPTLLTDADYDEQGRVECGWQWEPNSGSDA